MFFMNGISGILELFASNRPTMLHALWAVLSGFLLYCVRLISKRDYLSVQFSIGALCAIFFLTIYPIVYGVSIGSIIDLIITELLIFPPIIIYLLTSKRVQWLFQEQSEDNNAIEPSAQKKHRIQINVGKLLRKVKYSLTAFRREIPDNMVGLALSKTAFILLIPFIIQYFSAWRFNDCAGFSRQFIDFIVIFKWFNQLKQAIQNTVYHTVNFAVDDVV